MTEGENRLVELRHYTPRRQQVIHYFGDVILKIVGEADARDGRVLKRVRRLHGTVTEDHLKGQ